MTRFFVDGSGWNGLVSRACVTDERGKVLDFHNSTKGETNNEMEYHGVWRALLLAQEGDEIVTDSQLVHGQVVKGWKCNQPHLQVRRDACIDMLARKNVSLVWVPREQNVAGKVFE